MGGDRTRDRLNEFASARALTCVVIGSLAQAQLDFSPRRRRWSVGETADHLLLAEGLYRREMIELITLARAGEPTYRRHSFSEVNVAPLHLPLGVLSALEAPFGFMSRLLPDSIRSLVTEFPVIRARNPDAATPRPGRPAAELNADLAASIAETRAVIESNADLDFEKLVSEHPLTGRTNIRQILTFLAQHERRHHRQMETVRVDPRFPPGSSQAAA